MKNEELSISDVIREATDKYLEDAEFALILYYRHCCNMFLRSLGLEEATFYNKRVLIIENYFYNLIVEDEETFKEFKTC